jgi:ribosomal protein RSM22 (predicted rRNA methylase)
MMLPASLAGAIARHLDGRSRRDLRARAQQLSALYRDGQSTKAGVRDEADALAYALARLPATYAAARATLRRFAEEQPDFAPRRIIDLGCGLGAGAFAALEVWPQIEHATLIDRSREFLALAGEFSVSSDHPALRGAIVVEADLTAPPPLENADLLLLSYALTELDDAARTRLIETLVAARPQALAIVEPGAPKDGRRLMTARAQLIAAGAHIAFPCPHDAACPLAEPDWCHFSARLPRSRDHKFLKKADVPFEDEKFCALVVRFSLQRKTSAKARVLAPPLMRKWGFEAKLCAPQGLMKLAILKRDKDRYHQLRKTAWGDSIETPEQEPS